jgi:hypothetical protein
MEHWSDRAVGMKILMAASVIQFTDRPFFEEDSHCVTPGCSAKSPPPWRKNSACGGLDRAAEPPLQSITATDVFFDGVVARPAHGIMALAA